jgi:hypothetical protein
MSTIPKCRPPRWQSIEVATGGSGARRFCPGVEAETADEGLDVVVGLWGGESSTYRGRSTTCQCCCDRCTRPEFRSGPAASAKWRVPCGGPPAGKAHACFISTTYSPALLRSATGPLLTSESSSAKWPSYAARAVATSCAVGKPSTSARTRQATAAYVRWLRTRRTATRKEWVLNSARSRDVPAPAGNSAFGLDELIGCLRHQHKRNAARPRRAIHSDCNWMVTSRLGPRLTCKSGHSRD